MTHETRKLNGMLQRLCLLVFAAVCISGLNLPAQTTTGSLVGTAFDPSGAVIAKCTIKATNVDTNSVRQVQTNEAGYYNIPSLAPGTYKLEATAPGFSTITSQVVVKLGAAGTFDIHLTPGAVTQSIQVDASANSVELDTSSHQVDAQLPSQSIENLPTSGRDVFETLQSLPNVAPFQNAVGPVNNFRTASNSLTIGGSASGTTSYLQDGVTNIAMLTKTANFQPSIEATQEVSIIQNGASAQYDEPSVVNVITKGGTNKFHGRLYDYLQNDALNAAGYLNTSKPPLRDNQFGANLGGPIVRNKLFFFFDYAGLRDSIGAVLREAVPTAAERGGDFSADPTIYDPATYDPLAKTIQAFPGNKIPEGRISTFASLYLPYYPLPTNNCSVAGCNFQKSDANTRRYDSYLARADYTLGRNDAVYGAYETTNPTIVNPGYSPSPDFDYHNDQTGSNAFVQETHTFGPNMVNVARFGYNKSNIFYTLVGHKDYVTLFGLANLSPQPSQYQPPTVDFSTLSNLGAPASPQGAFQRLFEFSDNLTRTMGKHTLQAGGTLDYMEMNGNWGIWNNGQYVFNGQYTSNHVQLNSGNDFADFLLGFPQRAEGGTGFTVGSFRQWNILPYVQDDWRLTKSLTANLGLRYDYYGAPADADGHSNVYDVTTNTNHPGTFHQEYRDIAPRVGFAYSFGRGVAMHGGYGMYYAPFQYNQLQFMLVNAPNFYLQNNTYTVNQLTPVTDTFVAHPTLSAQAPFTIQLGMKTPKVQQWNLEIEKTLGRQWLARVAYLGNKSAHLQIRTNPNQAVLPSDPNNPGSIQSRRPYSWVGDVFQISGLGYGNYNALAAELRRSFSGGMSFSVNYVWSKSLDALNNGANTPQNAHDIAAEYGPSDFNPGQTFKASGVFQLPFGAGRPYLGRDNWFNRQVIGGWQSSGIFSVQSGLPFSASASDLSQTGAYHSLRANQTCNGNNPQNQSFSHWFDTSCFTQPGTGQFGDERRDNLTGPRNTNLNLSLFKSFPIKEGTSLQFRTDLVDALNHPLPGNPSSNVANARTFGVISSIPGSRTIQFALKFIY